MTSPRQITRRRALQITGAVGAAALLEGSAALAAMPEAVTWRGITLGAPATIRLYGGDRRTAEATLAAVRSEIRRLEPVFSLYRQDSAITQLNKTGRLTAPPPELVELLSTATGIAKATDGAFDVSMQPLWRLYADHFTRHPDSESGPSDAEVAEALARVGHHAITIRRDEIVLTRPGMALSLNGIAQGYITDRAAALIRRAGFTDVLVDLGETRALGSHPSGRPWHIGIRAPLGGEDISRKIPVVDRAVATSAPQGTTFENSGRFHHLLDPRSGRCVAGYRTLTVTAPTATIADGYSTAFSIMRFPDVERVARRQAGLRVFAQLKDGSWRSTGG